MLLLLCEVELAELAEVEEGGVIVDTTIVLADPDAGNTDDGAEVVVASVVMMLPPPLYADVCNGFRRLFAEEVE